MTEPTNESTNHTENETGREECHTSKCHATATTTLCIKSDYDSVSGEMKTTILEKSYCDRHAEMWLDMDGIEGRSYEVVE